MKTRRVVRINVTVLKLTEEETWRWGWNGVTYLYKSKDRFVVGLSYHKQQLRDEMERKGNENDICKEIRYTSRNSLNILFLSNSLTITLDIWLSVDKLWYWVYHKHSERNESLEVFSLLSIPSYQVDPWTSLLLAKLSKHVRSMQAFHRHLFSILSSFR